MRDGPLRWYIALSLAAGALLLLLSWMESGRGNVLSTTDRSIIGLALAAGCLFGLVRSVRPGATRILEDSGPRRTAAGGTPRTRAGHHPDCEPFANHVVELGGKKRCAGCTGLAIGSVAGLGAVLAYVFAGDVSPSVAVLFIALGFVLVAVGMIEIAGPRTSGSVHIVTNIAFVLGLVAVVVGTTQYSESVFVGILAVVLSFLWLDTRIVLSDTRHARTCAECPLDCKAY